MKILFVSKCSPFQVGGAEVRTWEVAREMTQMGHQVTILCAKMEAQELDYLERDGVRIHCKKILPDFLIKKFNYPHFFPLALSAIALMVYLPLLLRREKFDLIREDMSPFPPSGLWAFWRFKGARRIVVVHNLAGTWRGWFHYYGAFYGFFGYFMDRFLRRGMLCYDQIICVAQWLYQDLQVYPGLRGRLRYSANGVSKQFFETAKVAHCLSDEVQLLSVGRLVEVKGHATLLRSLVLLSETHAFFKLKVLGEGPLRRPLQKMLEDLGLTSRVEWMPWVSLQEMPLQYLAADFVIFPSFFEGGGPLALLEAMALRVPVIASDIAGVREFADERSVIFFEKGNPADLAEKIRWAIANKAQVDLKVEHASRVAARNSWRQSALEELN